MKVSKRVRLVTNLLLVLIVAVVAGVSFLPQKIVPIYNSENYDAIYNGNREQKRLSIMINVYENTEIVNDMLDELNKRKVKATFFVGGCWADDNDVTLNRIKDEGHEIGNHGYFHKDHNNLSYQENYQEISLTDSVVNALTGVKPTLFAPPSGSYNKDTLEAAYSLDYKVIMWSKDTIDWRDKDQATIFNRATQNLSNGDLILMHPKAHTAKVLGSILDYYLTAGFSVVTVSENLS